MESDLPVFKRRVNGETGITVATEIVGGSPLSVCGVNHVPVFIHLQDIRKDGISLFYRTGFVAVERKIIDPFKHVVAATRHEVGKRAKGSAK